MSDLQLTPAESRITALLAEGLRNKEIGQRAGIAEGTVKQHLHRIYFKNSLRNRMELMARLHAGGRDATT